MFAGGGAKIIVTSLSGTTRKQTESHRYGDNRKMAAGFPWVYIYDTIRDAILTCSQKLT